MSETDIDISKRCRAPRFSFSSLFAEDKSGGVFQWFEGQNINPSVNARAAIRKACDILGLGHGDEVLAPAYNCGSEVDPLFDCGADVILYRVSCDAVIDLDDLERRITARTRAIYVTHYFGFPQPEILTLVEVCRRRGLYLIEDCALSLLSRLDGRKLGTFGDVAVFCFYKFFPTIGGGGLVVNNPRLNADASLHKPAPVKFVWKAIMWAIVDTLVGSDSASKVKRFAKKLSREKRAPTKAVPVAQHRMESKMLPDMPSHYYFSPSLKDASISRITSRALRSFSMARSIETRRENFQVYVDLLQDESEVKSLFTQLLDGVCPLAFPVVLQNRDLVCDKLNEIGIAATPWWKGFHQRLNWVEFTEARALKEGVLALPLNQYMDRRHIKYICQELKRLCTTKPAVKEAPA